MTLRKSANDPAEGASRFTSRAVVQLRPGHVLRAAWDRQTDRACTLLLPGARVDPARFGALVSDVAAAHAVVRDPRVPDVIAFETEGEKPFVAFACGAVTDGVALLERLAAAPPIPYEAADGFIASLRAALQAAQGDDPAPRCFGRLSLANVLFDGDGRWHLVGLGRNFPVEDPEGRPDPAVAAWFAQEVGVGGAPSPVGDFIALRLLMRALMPFVETPTAIQRVLRGDGGADDEALLQSLLWFEREVMSAAPGARPTMARIVAESDRVRALLGVAPDPDGFARLVAAILGEAPAKPGASVLVVGEEGASAALPDGTALRFAGAARRILHALARAHAAGAEALSVWDLVAQGWPDERVRATSATNRAYVTINRMRAAGLGDLLERVDAGYRLAPSLVVKITDG
jgi:hypothetical protein